MYQAARNHKRSSAIHGTSSGTHFDSTVVEALFEREEEFAALAQALSDDAAPTALKPLDVRHVGVA